MATRRVEVFVGGCPVCEPAVKLVMELACPDCEVTVHDLHKTGEAPSSGGSKAERAARYGIKSVPAVVVNGGVVSCCQTSGPNRDELSRAGIGRRP